MHLPLLGTKLESMKAEELALLDRQVLGVIRFTLYFFPDNSKSLQLRGRRQIAKPRKYCLVRVIVFSLRVFSLFVLFLTDWDLG